MHRPSIIFVNRVYPPLRGATGRLLRDMARAFAREGWQVTVLTTGTQACHERDGAVRVIRVKASEKPGIFGYGIIWLKILIKLLRMPRPSLLVTMSDPPMLVCAGALYCRLKKTRHINWCHDLYPDVLPALGYKIPAPVMVLLTMISRRAMATADKVIVIGRCMARYLSVDGLDPKTITVIPNWPERELCNLAQKAPRSSKVKARGNVVPFPEEARAPDELLKTGPRFRVLYAGNIGRAHPIKTILDAAELLNAEHDDIELVFIGDGHRFDDLARERSRRRLDNIRLLPYQPVNRLREVMQGGDVHLVSFSEEAAGMVVPSKIYAALAVERPCILVGPAQSEAAKVLEDFNAGNVVPQGNARALADVIAAYREDENKWFAAHEGAKNAGAVFVPKESISAWMERAWAVVQPDLSSTIKSDAITKTTKSVTTISQQEPKKAAQ